jgi:hypothetical protein
VDLLAAFQVSMRAERAWHCDWNRYVKETSRVDWASLFGNNELGATFNILATFMRFAPSGWVYQNQLNYCHLFDRISLRTVDVPARRVYPEVAAAVNAEPGLRVGFHPFNLLGRLLFPATGSAARKFAHTQTQLNEAVVACALERHRLIHGSYPETVQALVPRFLEKIPQDLFSGQPLQYRHTAQGQYLLSSADWSEKAEVGGQRTPWVDSLVIGDWDWELPQKL